MEEQNIQSTQELTDIENTDQNGQQEQNQEMLEAENSVQQTNQDLQENESLSEEKINLGKFKDVSSLLTAYNNLQAEFTKKCQKLSEISKNSCDNGQNLPPQQKTEWAEKFSNFLSTHQEAKEYSKEISELLINNTELLNSENALEKAWTKVLMNNFNALKQQMQNTDFLTQLVSDNAEIKDNIINEYINGVKEKHSPKLINSKNGAFAVSKNSTASTLEDASRLVRAMFK